ncbi:MAG TPA: VOC family protein [Dehalococcoidia bacterium]|nr:VOC family protein [Dehalococcoidia bacterium]
MGRPVVYFEIMGKDAIGLQKFYGDLFDWQVGQAMGSELGNYGLVEEKSSGLPGGIGQTPQGCKHLTFYVEVPDLQATLDRAVAIGGSVVMPPTEIPGVVSLAQFADPDGNIVGLIKG